MAESKRSLNRARRYLLAGVLTLIPIWVTWLVFRFVLGQLSSIGMPWVRVLSSMIRDDAPLLGRLLVEEWFQWIMAILVTLVVLYVLGWAATRVIGRRFIGVFDGLMQRIPLVEKVYGGTKRLLTALEQRPSDVQRVVLIAFPTPHMKTIGFVTRIVTDESTGARLAMVYVPTTPNPSSGYLEIVPVEYVTETDLTVDEAVSIIVSGGLVSPESIPFTNSKLTPPAGEAPPARAGRAPEAPGSGSGSA